MNGERKSNAAAPSSHVCPRCKQPVETVVERHKTMGMYVPVWTAGPCHNPRCQESVAEPGGTRSGTRRHLAES